MDVCSGNIQLEVKLYILCQHRHHIQLKMMHKVLSERKVKHVVQL